MRSLSMYMEILDARGFRESFKKRGREIHGPQKHNKQVGVNPPRRQPITTSCRGQLQAVSIRIAFWFRYYGDIVWKRIPRGPILCGRQAEWKPSYARD